MKIYWFWLQFYWSLFPRVRLTISQHWFREWLHTERATSHYLNQWWPSLLKHICVTWFQWVNIELKNNHVLTVVSSQNTGLQYLVAVTKMTIIAIILCLDAHNTHTNAYQQLKVHDSWKVDAKATGQAQNIEEEFVYKRQDKNGVVMMYFPAEYICKQQ